MTPIDGARRDSRPLRFAFLTTQYGEEETDNGGLASYLQRTCYSLRTAGHEPEVFTVSNRSPSLVEIDGVRVQRVKPASRGPQLWTRLLSRMPVPYRVLPIRIEIRARQAFALAAALEARHEDSPFDVVQSPNYGLSGMYVEPRAGRVHIIRCSQLTHLCARAERTFFGGLRGGFNLLDDVITHRVERDLFSRVDAVYAPSDFTASAYRRDFGLPVSTVRPPFVLERVDDLPPRGLPPRFFAFVGKADRVKGADVLVRATAMAALKVPDISVVCAGPLDFIAVARRARLPSANLRWIGPLNRSALYAFERRAVAVVAPSRCDNLPNTVIEALMLGVPVIGSRGASIDELVEDGRTGALVAIGDVTALADCLVRAWRNDGNWLSDRSVPPPRLAMLEPDRAIADLLALISDVRRAKTEG